MQNIFKNQDKIIGLVKITFIEHPILEQEFIKLNKTLKT